MILFLMFFVVCLLVNFILYNKIFKERFLKEYMCDDKFELVNFVKKRADMLISLFIFLVIFANYILFLAPSVTPRDSAELIVVSAVLGIPHPTGYPVYTWIGHLFTLLPVGSVAYRVNLMSAFFGAVTTALLYLLIFNIINYETSDNDFSWCY